MASQALTPIDDAPRAVATQTPERAHFELMQRKAAVYAASPLIPEALRQGGQQTALANCYIALSIAERMQENELTVLQNIHIVKGKAGFSAQFMIARANASGVFKGRINWRMSGQGPTLAAEAYATLADTGEEVSFPVDMAMAQAEGWTSNPKYKSIPHLMLRYRSATFLVRLYAPDVMFGYRTAEEVEDIEFAAAPAAEPLSAKMLIEQAAPASDDDAELIPEGRGDNDHGEQHNDTHADHPMRATVDDWVGRCTTAQILGDVLNIASEFAEKRELLPDELVTEVEGAIAEAKGRFKQGGK